MPTESVSTLITVHASEHVLGACPSIWPPRFRFAGRQKYLVGTLAREWDLS